MSTMHIDNSDNTANSFNAIEAGHERSLQQRGVVLGIMTARQERYYREKHAKDFYQEDYYARQDQNPEDALIDMIDGKHDVESESILLQEELGIEDTDDSHTSLTEDVEAYLRHLVWEQEMNQRTNYTDAEQDSIDRYENRFASDLPFWERKEPVDRENENEARNASREFRRNRKHLNRRDCAQAIRRHCSTHGWRKPHFLDDVEHRSSIRHGSWNEQLPFCSKIELAYDDYREWNTFEASIRHMEEDHESEKEVNLQEELTWWENNWEDLEREAFDIGAVLFASHEYYDEVG